MVRVPRNDAAEILRALFDVGAEGVPSLMWPRSMTRAKR